MTIFSPARLGAALLLLHTAACITVTHTQTADTLGEGHVQIAATPSYLREVGGDLGEAGFLGGLQARVLYGTNDTMDVGGQLTYQRLFPSEDGGEGTIVHYGADVLTRFQLYRSDSLRVALAPSLGFNHVGPTSGGEDSESIDAFQLKVPLLIGIPVGEHQLVVGPTVSDAFVFGLGDDKSNLLNVGTTVGFAARIPGTGMRLMPEVGVLYPLLGTAAGEGSEFNDSGALYFQASLGLLFDVGGGAP